MQRFHHVLLVVLISLSFAGGQKIQSPSKFLGYELGTQFSRHHQVVDYFKHVAAGLPNQVKLEQYGETYERRPLYVAYVSSEENIRNLEAIRQNNLKTAGIIEGTATNNGVAIVWLSYNVHGNEASSTEAAMSTVYRLLTEKQDWLKNTVVIFDPCINPDGRDRYVNWFNETASNPYDIDQQASEHIEPWPGGRANHYLFDLNRDWVWASQIESASRLKVYNKWLPHIHVDFHEQGLNNPYYFAPAAEPYHEVISDWQRDFQNQIGENHARHFDANGWLYFTRERFDLLYPSYGDTYPTFMGAIGMTYEQAGHGRGGLGVLNDEGEILTLIDRLNHHTTTGLSTIEISSKNATKLNTEFARFFDTSGLKYKSYVLQGDADKIDAVKSLLDKHEIAHGSSSAGSVSGFRYSTGSQGSLNSSVNDLVVSIDQPKGKMVKVLFEPQAKLSDSLTYDITAWSIPYAYGLESVASTRVVPSGTSVSSAISNTKDVRATGYILNWDSLKDAKFLADLLKQGVRVRFTEKPIVSDGQRFERGSLIIIRGDNKTMSSFDDLLLTTAKTYNRKLHAIASGLSKSGPDFGSPDIKLVNRQKIALLSGQNTSSLDYGAIWHFFEQQLLYPVTSINSEHFQHIDLEKYNVLILPSGRYEMILDAQGMKKLRSWIENGGKAIAIGKALGSFADSDDFALQRTKTEDEQESNKLVPYADRERENLKGSISGAIFRTNVDATHPMAFGYSDTYFSLKTGSDSYHLLDNGYNVAHIGNRPAQVSGFAGSIAVKNLSNSLVFGEERVGRGSVIYMVDNPLFRSFWENGKLFMINAIFLVNSNVFEL
jgi:hypothetical protein